MRNKTSEELAQETDSDLVICEAMGCESFAKFYTKDQHFLCVTHLAVKYGISPKTEEPAKLVLRS